LGRRGSKGEEEWAMRVGNSCGYRSSMQKEEGKRTNPGKVKGVGQVVRPGRTERCRSKKKGQVENSCQNQPCPKRKNKDRGRTTERTRGRGGSGRGSDLYNAGGKRWVVGKKDLVREQEEELLTVQQCDMVGRNR